MMTRFGAVFATAAALTIGQFTAAQGRPEAGISVSEVAWILQETTTVDDVLDVDWGTPNQPDPSSDLPAQELAKVPVFVSGEEPSTALLTMMLRDDAIAPTSVVSTTLSLGNTWRGRIGGEIAPGLRWQMEREYRVVESIPDTTLELLAWINVTVFKKDVDGLEEVVLTKNSAIRVSPGEAILVLVEPLSIAGEEKRVMLSLRLEPWEWEALRPGFAATVVNRTSICAGKDVPDGWIKVDDRWDPFRCGKPANITQNVWIIERYDNKEVGTRMSVCANAPTPEGWVVKDKFWRVHRCEWPTTPTENVKTIERVQ